jgi:hypothetical protein
MDGNDFLRIIRDAYVPFLRELDFTLDRTDIQGREYSVSFTGPANTVVVSYEPGDEAFFVFVFGRKGKHLTDIDDSSQTPRLSDLNTKFMKGITPAERSHSDASFGTIATGDRKEEELVKAAKELRLVLPRHLAVQSTLEK